MEMLEIDWVGPITLAYSITGVMYVLLVIDYFTRFVWAKGYLKHTVDKVIILTIKFLPYLDIAKQYTPTMVPILSIKRCRTISKKEESRISLGQ